MTSMQVGRRGDMAQPTAAAFVPTSISGLQLWLDASQLTGLADADPIATSADRSGNSRDATQGTSAQRPTYKTGILNGKPVMRFDGVDDNLQMTFTLAQPMTIAAVVKSADASAANRGFIDGTNAVRPAMYQTGSTWRVYAGAAEINSGVTVDTGGHVLIYTFDNTSRPEYVDGAAASSGNAGSGGWTSTPIYVGKLQSGNYWSGDIAEILVYNTALSSTDRGSVQTYLKAKWGTP